MLHLLKATGFYQYYRYTPALSMYLDEILIEIWSETYIRDLSLQDLLSNIFTNFQFRHISTSFSMQYRCRSAFPTYFTQFSNQSWHYRSYGLSENAVISSFTIRVAGINPLLGQNLLKTAAGKFCKNSSVIPCSII